MISLFRRLCLPVVSSVLLLILLVCCTQAQTDFFWSTDDLNQGADNNDAFIIGTVGDTYTFYLYYSTNGPIDSDMNVGAFLDVSLSSIGVVEFLSATAYDFEILVGNEPIGNRWLGEMGSGGSVGVEDVAPEFIDQWYAFTLTEPGIQEANTGAGAFTDSGYDFAADAFLWGEIEIRITGVGSTDVILQQGDGGVINGDEFIFPTFGSLTITGDCGKHGDLGDMNDDGTVSLLDVPLFVDALISGEYVSRADVNCDGSVDLQDVTPFVELVGG